MTKHGQARKKHKTVEYETWCSIKRRCHCPTHKDFPNYGGRGVKVCDRWRTSFANFYRDMGPRPSDRHSLDRINNDGDYEPANCRWATVTEQNRNRRGNRWITLGGQTKLLSDWARDVRLSPATILKRLRRGWTPAAAVLVLPKG